jgi:hypothetical protein
MAAEVVPELSDFIDMHRVPLGPAVRMGRRKRHPGFVNAPGFR